jgi:LDH2 family malate/lactate/ureidoglycolate dehydrogenase
MNVKITELRDIITTILQHTYYSSQQATAIADVLLYAEMSGKNTQGILKLLGTEPIQNIKPEQEPRISKDTKLSALINGGGNPGILVSHMATRMAIEKCKAYGIAIIGTNNTFSSTGAIGYYAREIAKHDFIGIVMAGSPGGVAPHGGIEPLFGTNPIACSFPTEKDPVVFDMATAAITWYGLVRAKALKQKLPDNVALDSEGNLTTDPSEAMRGAILPFDRSYKGSGLSMMIEMFTGPLVGAAFADSEGKGDWGNVFLAIDPELLIDKKEFKKQNSLLIEKIKMSKKKKEFSAIRIPGENAQENLKNAKKSGEVAIDEKLYTALKGLVR